MATTVPTVETISAGYAALTKSDASARWRWARQILIARGAQKSDKLRTDLDKEIGEECASAVGRKKAYSPQWVRAIINAAKKFPTEPKSAQDAERFVALCNCVSATKTAKKGAPATKEDAIRMMQSAARMAIKRGATADEISDAVLSLLGEDSADEDSDADESESEAA